ncbi:sigma-70 family RNA polymerase sigma factor [Luteolibacter flavescens]|uniref:Sigma-70 family RNA polymerase sigma factor n=1 Tax=Luteolibacter flavescens TaxID=1859460 RepID=A0ABT3FRZ9_9BACT|nr:sigma-70 family RNA polymerase sigma factor [Luteolibacter flavescens]MCW1886079.1 sigma-70 family RNA polymerase sigma factor [Luteolibacter flavescens]
MPAFRLFSRSSDAARGEADFRRYVEDGNADAFRRLVERHLPVVQETARRVLGGRSGWIDDVAQEVFLMLARKGRQLPPEIVLSAWLHRQTVRRALDVVRSESRREKREEIAELVPSEEGGGDVWSAIAPLLDREMLRLPEQDRQLLALRFMERLSSDEVARRLGLSSAAVRKRVERALAKLRERLVVSPLPGMGAGAGTLTVTALAAYLSAPAANAATSSQVAAICSGSLSAAATPTFSLTTLTLMTKSQLYTAGAVVAIGTSAFLAGRSNGFDAGRESIAAVADVAEPSRQSVDGKARRSIDRQTVSTGTFPNTKEGRLAMLRAILGNADPLSRAQALDRFIAKMNPEEFEEIAIFLKRQEPETASQEEAVASAGQVLLAAWAHYDPAAVLKFCGADPSETVLQMVGKVWGARDPDAAIAWATARSGDRHPDVVDPFMCGLISSMAADDLNRAESLMSKMPSGLGRRAVLEGMLPQIVARGEESMIRWLDGLTDENLRKGATNLIAKEMANTDPRAAVEWILQRMGTDAERSNMDIVFQKWVAKDAREALASFDTLPAGATRDSALYAVVSRLCEAELTPESSDWIIGRLTARETLPLHSMNKVLARWAETNPSAATGYFKELPDSVAYGISGSLAEGLSKTSPSTAAALMDENPGRMSPAAMGAVVSEMVELDPNYAIRYLEREGVEDLARTAVILAWLNVRPDEVKSYLETNFESMPQHTQQILRSQGL